MCKEFIAMWNSVTSASHIFVSPEVLSHTIWREALDNSLVSSPVCAVVIDEAHTLGVFTLACGCAFDAHQMHIDCVHTKCALNECGSECI